MTPNAPLPLPPSSSYQPSFLVKNTNVSTPPTPPPCFLPISFAAPHIHPKNSSISSIPPRTPPPFPPHNPQNSSISSIPLVPTKPLPPSNPQNSSISSIPLVPPPPLPPHNSSFHNPIISSIPAVPPPPSSLMGLDSSSGPPPPPTGINGPIGVLKGRSFARSTSNRCMQLSGKRTLKPLHWVKVTRAMQGSLWAETQKFDEASKAPEFDMLELESLFSAAVPNSERGSGDKSCGRSALGQKGGRVQLIDLRRANNCEIMLTKVKIPLTDLLSSVLALDDSVLDVDQVDNLIKFCPTKEEMDLLKNFGDKESLGKCEQYFLELMKVPRVESKLRVFSFKIQFRSQVSELSGNLNIVNSAAHEIRNSVRLKRIMQTILSLGNALNQGTARGSAIGFRLDSLLKLTETRSRNNKMTLMHYLCKVLAEKLPELLSFPKDLVSLEVSSKIQLKTLAEEMQAISKGLEKVEQELTASENDGPISDTFCKTLKEFLVGAEAEVRALTSLYSNVGRNADALALYFGEDPARCPFEQVIGTLLNFVRLFIRAHEENCKLLELEKKRQQKEEEKNCKLIELEKKRQQKEEENEKKLNAAKMEAEAHSPSKKPKNN
ncbi:hypothetical protein HPP92_021962 [Vanilla planifolia]|uniref:Formin-like protein n=1 Tax=Vanilla planifolia TaxID=51239 RepID=A0A835UI58_VANPL|nr:hypothetical protein HPP92_021962 [Vanilla planifolia]